MAGIGRRGFLAVAIIFHVIYALSIFDIYFVSPVVHGMRAFKVDQPEAPAKRLVLFVGDGLRADKAFQSFPDPSPSRGASKEESQRPRPLAPYLRSRVLEHGTFGVSHTRVPTESRPGHVALIAGLYEDVSAVTTGWKLNPVNFDSVFNRSRHTWSWGSPDILPMFEQGATPGRVDAFCYGAEDEDFTGDSTKLDTWVFERVKGMFEQARHNETLNAALREDKVVFFLHLLGLDTAGHAFRPYSKEYLNNIKVVDKGVQEITGLIERFYGDAKTAFVFTADHGMSDWGSHGDGHPDNTRTPLIAWGSGVAKPVTVRNGKAPGHEDGFSADWGLDKVTRHDVAQADVAALMAYLAGLEYPVNSVGELPLSYIDATPRAKADALLTNAKGILEMYKVKETYKKNAVLRYRSFAGFVGKQNGPDERVSRIRSAIDAGHLDEAIRDCEAFMKLTLQGIRYLQTYDWLFLRTVITCGYAGFVAYAFTTVINLYVLRGAAQTGRTFASTITVASISVALFAFIFMRHSPWTYYAYAAFPVYFWEAVYASRKSFTAARGVFFGDMSDQKAYSSLAFTAIMFLVVLEALAQSYYHRQAFTFCYLVAAAWPAFYGTDFTSKHKLLSTTWALACAVMSIFTLLPANKVEHLSQVMLGGVLMFAVGALYLLLEKSILAHSSDASKSDLADANLDSTSRIVLGVQTGLIALSMLTTRSSALSIQARQGLPLGAQIVGWMVLIASFTIPFMHGLQPNKQPLRRLMVLFLTFAPIFIILTISYEGLFYLAFCTLLFSWCRLERHVYLHNLSRAAAQVNAATADANSQALKPVNGAANGKAKDTAKTSSSSLPKAFRTLSLTDLRISLFYLYLLQSAFFSTGNIASISTFSLDAVFRLLPVFDPFSQGALLLLKLLIPFFVLAVNLGVLSKSVGFGKAGHERDGGALGIMAVVMGDWLTLRFFWSVKDEGSWLEIGESITKFIIASMLGAFVSGLEVVGEYFVSGIEFEDAEEPGQAVAADTKSQ